MNREELVAVSSDHIEDSTALIVSGYDKLSQLIQSKLLTETICNTKPLPQPAPVDEIVSEYTTQAPTEGMYA